MTAMTQTDAHVVPEPVDPTEAELRELHDVLTECGLPGSGLTDRQEEVLVLTLERSLEEIWENGPEARAMRAATAGGAVRPLSREGLARVISASYGENPDDDAPLTKICGPNNEPLPNWMAYEEQAEAILSALEPAAATAQEGAKPYVIEDIKWGDDGEMLPPTPAPEPGSVEGLADLKARLRSEGAHIRDKHRHVKAFYAMEEAADTLTTLQQQLAAYREALSEIAKPLVTNKWYDDCERRIRIARAALAAKSAGGGE